jgi:hypothetical protein
MITYNVQELTEQEKGPIWVRNCSNETMEDGQGGDVFISISINNTTRQLKIPLSWLPMNLTAHYPRKILLESIAFTESINKGLIQAIDTSSAEKLLGRAGASEEQSRLKERDQAVREAINSRGLNRNTVVINASDEAPDTVAPTKPKKTTVARIEDESEDEDQPVEAVTARFKARVLKMNSLSAKEALTYFQSIGDLDEDQGRYILDKCEHPKIVKIVKDQL